MCVGRGVRVDRSVLCSVINHTTQHAYTHIHTLTHIHSHAHTSLPRPEAPPKAYRRAVITYPAMIPITYDRDSVCGEILIAGM